MLGRSTLSCSAEITPRVTACPLLSNARHSSAGTIKSAASRNLRSSLERAGNVRGSGAMVGESGRQHACIVGGIGQLTFQCWVAACCGGKERRTHRRRATRWPVRSTRLQQQVPGPMQHLAWGSQPNSCQRFPCCPSCVSSCARLFPWSKRARRE